MMGHLLCLRIPVHYVCVWCVDILQVYRARLRSTGEEVAVKVQRPQALATISKVGWCRCPGMEQCRREGGGVWPDRGGGSRGAVTARRP